MTPVTFNDTLGWLHAPRGGVGRVAVLICPGMMQDALLSHCSLRVLGERLAEAGYWALRFDYPGTADSLAEGDIEPPEGHWQSWLKSIEGAADWLRETTGASELVFAGLRIGATLATLAASRRHDVAGVIQFAPVVRGNSYVRQLLVQAQLQTGQPLPADADLVFYEFRLSPRTLDEMRAVDLRIAGLPGKKIALYPRADSRLIDECTQAWTAAGANVTRGTWNKLEPMLRHNIIEEDTLADFSDVVAWLSRAMPYDATHKAVTPAATPLSLEPAACVETPMRFGRRGRLFGVLCRPAQGQPDTAVIITNSGRDPHYGSCRQSVTLARQLARQGIASLRMDFAGLGDSLGPIGKEDLLTPMFEADRVPDIRGALDALERLGYRRFALQGLCAGAYHSLQGGLNDPRVSTLLLVNIPLFSLPGEVMEFLTHRTNSFVHYFNRLTSLDGLKRLFTGKVNVLRILRGQVDQVRMHASETVQGIATKVGGADRRTPARRAMADLSARGVRTLFLFSAGQGEIDAFAREFGPAGEGLAGYPGAVMHVIENMDHDMSQAPGRAVGQALMVNFMAPSSRS
ncbi:MAG: alpha/beta hydrolase [Proteobacteria bacterium]|nr:alpha/beta hydrolase [Pseudomonadota bacterium]